MTGIGVYVAQPVNVWTAFNNGSGSRRWFVARETASGTDYHCGKNDELIRYGSFEAASRAADRLNDDYQECGNCGDSVRYVSTRGWCDGCEAEADSAEALEQPAPPYPGITYVIPCSGAKLDQPAPARDLYRGSMFRHTLENAERSARMDSEQLGKPARVLILSGLYGLVGLDQVLEPYEQRMDKPGSVTAATLTEQARELGIDWGSAVYCLLPRPYYARLSEALRALDVYPQDVYEGCGGIGPQRRANSHIGRPTGGLDVDEPGDGLTVWLGADASAFSWRTRILVSYDRLRDAKTLPVATNWWVLDSAAYPMLDKNAGWTIPGAEYAADIRRYGEEIGHLKWAAPQDWPAAPHLLERTGLTAEDHQLLTIASVKYLRAADTGVHIIPVLTGPTPEAYLRHAEMYREAGIDMHDEPIVGVGALLFRPVKEAAEIIRMLHGAGFTRLHAFGGKGQLLDMVGHLIESVDSAGWSADARRATDECPHGLVKWERNCPQAARDWAALQRRRAELSRVQLVFPLPGGRRVDARRELVRAEASGCDPWGPVLDALPGL